MADEAMECPACEETMDESGLYRHLQFTHEWSKHTALSYIADEGGSTVERLRED
jgi:hypothetical protein